VQQIPLLLWHYYAIWVASKSLTALIDLESSLNDGFIFVIFMNFQDIVIRRNDSAKKIVINITKFTLSVNENFIIIIRCDGSIPNSPILGGLAFGLAWNILAVIILNLVNNELEVEILSTFALAYLIFYVADIELGVSAVHGQTQILYQ
jgi:NhaP-type Na+/H+ or K+/H+ antiporter